MHNVEGESQIRHSLPVVPGLSKAFTTAGVSYTCISRRPRLQLKMVLMSPYSCGGGGAGGRWW